MNYKYTAVKCEDCGFEFWAKDEKAKCPICKGYALIDQKREDDYMESLATGHDTC